MAGGVFNLLEKDRVCQLPHTFRVTPRRSNDAPGAIIDGVLLLNNTKGEKVVPGIVIDLVAVLVTVISFVALIAFTAGCDRL